MQSKIENGKVVFHDPEAEKQKQREAKLQELADKKKQGKLTIEDIFEQGQIIIEMLQ